MAGIRAVKKGCRLRLAGFDMLSLNCSLMPLRNTSEERETKLSLACPDCAADGTPTKMEQFYIGACGHTPVDGRPGYKTGDMQDRLRLEGKTPVLVSAEELAALQPPAEETEVTFIDFTVEKRDAVEAATYPAGNVYWVEPDAPTSVYGILSDLANDPTYALLGTLTLRGSPQLVQLVPHRGGIVLSQVLRPSEMYVYDVRKTEAKDQEKVAAVKLVAALVNEEFDANSYSNDRAKKVRELIEAKLAGTPVATVSLTDKGKAAAPAADMTAMLEAALAAVQAKKGA